ncbi:CDP-glycerol glycerophosphotransferase family protein [Glaesserella parasuis]|nr:CDP-glycerol glycerophosphotransferase family protein [Glaesserella parasuis]
MRNKIIWIYRAFHALSRVILGYPLYYISGFIPRKKCIWVFGSFGIFNDNSRYLYEYVIKANKHNIKAIWISNNKQSIIEASKYGKAYHALSINGLYYTLIAKVYIFSCYVSDINYFTSRGAIKVNLWHGIPLKKIEFDINTPPLNKVFKDASFISKVLRPQIYQRNDFLISPTKYIADYSLKSAFRINDDNIILAQYPRVSYLKSLMLEMKNKDKLEYSIFQKVFLYTPTWRDNSYDFIKKSEINFELLDNLMKENNSIFLVKLHSATKLSVDFSKYNNIRLTDNKQDPMKLLAIADCLITDYSSIYLDYLIVDRPIIFFSFDLDEYLQGREMYFDYDSVLAGNRVNSFSELFREILKVFVDDRLGKERRKKMSSLFLSNDTDSNKSIVDKIINKLGH